MKYSLIGLFGLNAPEKYSPTSMDRPELLKRSSLSRLLVLVVQCGFCSFSLLSARTENLCLPPAACDLVKKRLRCYSDEKVDHRMLGFPSWQRFRAWQAFSSFCIKQRKML